MWRLRRWAKRIAPKALILLYHRVAEVSSDPQLLCVSPKHFAEHLEVLRRNYHPLSLRSLRRRLALNLWPPRSVVITFDDGYADNLHNALPLLEAADVPATVFVVAGQLDSRREFWWDDLERILLSTPVLPDQLNLTVDGLSYVWNLKSPNSDDCSDQRWHVLMEAEPTPRQAAYRELAALLRGMESQARERQLEQLAAWAGLAVEGRPAYRALTSDEVKALAQDGLVEVGAHTMTHPVLSNLPGEAQQAEIVSSKRRLEELLGQPVTSFSYPYGTQSDYTTDTVRLVREAGFDCACSNFPGLVTFASDPYQLPRFLVRDWDGGEFARRLEGWFAG
jgi:peptidoglycan/xylan/chitin deacetylase (PgdA/CDA1 family)